MGSTLFILTPHWKPAWDLKENISKLVKLPCCQPIKLLKNLDTTPSWFNFAIDNDNNKNKRTFLAPLQLLWGLVLMNGELICLYLY